MLDEFRYVFIKVYWYLVALFFAALLYQYTTSSTELQFQGKVQVQGDNGMLVQWDEDYNDMSSAKFLALQTRMEAAVCFIK